MLRMIPSHWGAIGITWLIGGWTTAAWCQTSDVRETETTAGAVAADTATGPAGLDRPFDTGPFETGPFDTGPFDTGPFDIRDEAEAWKTLGLQPPRLPVWARTLAPSLPGATVALLDLDDLHRRRNPLGPQLAAQLRWHVADAMDCDYARQYATADLRRSGMSDAELTAWQTGQLDGSDPEQPLWKFARQLTLQAHGITDQAVADLLQTWEPEVVVGVVHTVAFANFQNRLWLGLGCRVESDGPYASFAPPSAKHEMPGGDQSAAAEAPPRPDLAELNGQLPGAGRLARPDWGAHDFAAIEAALERQRQRPPRIPMPAPRRWAELPAEDRQRSERIVWSHMSLGYQPDLTQAWFHCMRTFRQDADMDRVFANSVFWVVTRSNECFY